MRPFYKRHLLIAGFLCFAAVAGAQQTQVATPVTVVPRLVRFAGSFHPPANQPSGPIGATFAIFAEQEGGTPLWSEDRNVELDASGNYTVLLGAASNEGVPVDLFTAGDARWLQVKFYTPGELDAPRVLLVSVPYALKAGDADTLGGKPAAAYLLAGSSASTLPVGASGVAQPAQPDAAVSVKVAAGVKPALTSTGTTNYIAKFTDTSGDLGNSGMYQNGSNIGVGTTAAAISMDIRPTATSTYAQLGVAQTVDYMTLFASDIYGPAFYWDPTKSLRFGKGGTGLYNANGFVESMRIQPNGFVGIGTQSPAATLEVNGTAQVDGNLTISGNILAGTGVPLIYAPNNSTSNFGAGLDALQSVTTGSQNTAIGDIALQANTTGIGNVAVGSRALAFNTNGGSNTAVGYLALSDNTTGQSNLAIGAKALQNNTTGTSNMASGTYALTSNTTGGANTASGCSVLNLNTVGSNNTAAGFGSMQANTTGNNNTSSGFQTLFDNATGSNNTASGYQALYACTSGSNNIAIGYEAGSAVTGASDNIDIGNTGTSTDSGTIRIGTAGTQTTAFIAGIRGVTTGSNNAIPVMVDSNGQLGTISSSRRYKEDIQDMGDSSGGLLRLRPVTFRYKKPFGDGSQPMQYGLIAEEVAEVYPDLVARSADGQIETVKYQVLDSMLLNELQKQNVTIATQKQQIRSLEERLARVEAALEGTSAAVASGQ
jgi:hypothetical protein